MGLSSSLAAVVSALLLLCYLTNGDAGGGGGGGLSLDYYSGSCPRAEEIIKEQVKSLYDKHGNTAVSWVRALFHDCMVKSCDASLLLESTSSLVSEKSAPRSFGMRNFKYINTIKAAVEQDCPATVSCADIVALAATEGVVMLGGPSMAMSTGRRDSRESYYGVVEQYIPNHNETMSVVLSRFASMGIDAEGTVALLGAHSVGRVHCFNLVQDQVVALQYVLTKHELTKHIDIDASYMRTQVQDQVVALQYVPSELQLTDFFTKAQTRAQHSFYLSKLHVVDPPKV